MFNFYNPDLLKLHTATLGIEDYRPQLNIILHFY